MAGLLITIRSSHSLDNYLHKIWLAWWMRLIEVIGIQPQSSSFLGWPDASIPGLVNLESPLGLKRFLAWLTFAGNLVDIHCLNNFFFQKDLQSGILSFQILRN